MKKILTWRKLLLILLVTVMYFFLFLWPYTGQNNGSYRIEADVARTFGTICGDFTDREEYERLKQEIPYQGKEKLESVVENSHTFREKGITSLEDLMMAKGTQEEKDSLWEQLSKEISLVEKSEGEMTALFEDMIELNCWSVFLDTYRTEVLEMHDGESVYYKNPNENQRQRILERNRQEIQAFVPFRLIDNNLELLQFLAPLVCLSGILLIVPYMIRENRSGMVALQYSSSRGRRYYRSHFWAVLASGLLVITADLGLYIFFAWQNRMFEFWNLPVSSCISAFISWFGWSVGEMTIWALLLILLAALGTDLLVFVVTSGCSGYIQGIALQLPLVAAAATFGILGLRQFTEITQNRWAVFIVTILWFTAGIAAFVGREILEKRRDI